MRFKSGIGGAPVGRGVDTVAVRERAPRGKCSMLPNATIFLPVDCVPLPVGCGIECGAPK